MIKFNQQRRIVPEEILRKSAVFAALLDRNESIRIRDFDDKCVEALLSHMTNPTEIKENDVLFLCNLATLAERIKYTPLHHEALERVSNLLKYAHTRDVQNIKDKRVSASTSEHLQRAITDMIQKNKQDMPELTK